MLKSVTKSHTLQLLLQARAIWVGVLEVLGNQSARVALVAALTAPGGAYADVVVPGDDTAGYQVALQLWLDGSDDLEALRQLSGLANEGNTAAQILLARIARAEHTHVAVTQSLQRRERIALLREDVGLSGRDWMRSAAEVSPLAKAYWAFVSSGVVPEYDANDVNILIKSGDIRIGYRALNNLAAPGATAELALLTYAHQDAIGFASLPFLNTVLRSLVAEGASTLPVPKDITTEDQAGAFFASLSDPRGSFAAFGLQYFIVDGGYRVPEETITSWVRDAPELQPLTAFCGNVCSQEFNSCMISTVRALTFSTGFPHPLASPAQPLIPDHIYWASSRFERDFETLLRVGNWNGCG